MPWTWHIRICHSSSACVNHQYTIYYYPGPKKKEPSRDYEKNTVPRVISCSITHDQCRAKVADSHAYRWPCPALIALDQVWYHKIEQCSSRRKSRRWFLFFFVQGSEINYCWLIPEFGIPYKLRFSSSSKFPPPFFSSIEEELQFVLFFYQNHREGSFTSPESQWP